VRSPHIFTKQSKEKIHVDYMVIHQYSTTPPKVTITPIQNYYQVRVTNPNASDLINYQLKLSCLGIISRNESQNTEYIPEDFDKHTISTNWLYRLYKKPTKNWDSSKSSQTSSNFVVATWMKRENEHKINSQMLSLPKISV
jgi:hypothetical protein